MVRTPYFKVPLENCLSVPIGHSTSMRNALGFFKWTRPASKTLPQWQIHTQNRFDRLEMVSLRRYEAHKAMDEDTPRPKDIYSSKTKIRFSWVLHSKQCPNQQDNLRGSAYGSAAPSERAYSTKKTLLTKQSLFCRTIAYITKVDKIDLHGKLFYIHYNFQTLCKRNPTLCGRWKI